MRWALHVLGASAFLLHAAGPAAAQPAPATDPLPERRGSGAPSLPPADPAAAPRPPAAVRTGLPSDARFLLTGVQLLGNTVLGQADIARAAAPFLGRPVGLQDIEDLRRQLTLLYVDQGYINSGVVVPDQTVANGVLALQAVEGKLTGVETTGNRHYRSSYLTDRLQRGVSVPFNVNELGRQQQILLQDPGLTRLNLSIQPGLAPGEAQLVGDALEASRYSLTLQVANSQSPTVGEVRGQIQGAISNLLGVGDLLALQYGRSQGINDGAASYSLPIASDDTRVSLRYDANNTLVVAQGLGPANITSRYDSIGLGLSRPFYRTPKQALTLGLSAEWRRSQTFAGGAALLFLARRRRLLLGSGVVMGPSRNQAGDEGAKQGFAALASVVHELEKAEVVRQLVLRDAAVRAQPGPQQRPETLDRVDVDLAEAVAILVAGILAAPMADRLVSIAPSGQAGVDAVRRCGRGCPGRRRR